MGLLSVGGAATITGIGVFIGYAHAKAHASDARDDGTHDRESHRIDVLRTAGVVLTSIGVATLIGAGVRLAILRLGSPRRQLAVWRIQWTGVVRF